MMKFNKDDDFICIKEIAQKKGVFIDQFIASAVAEKILALITEDYLKERVQRADKRSF